MSEPTLIINTVLDNKSIDVPYTNNTTAEDVCIYVCKTLNIGPSARHLFALRIAGKSIFLTPSALFGSKYVEFDFRIRFRVYKLQNLRKLDIRAYDYFFHQTRLDVLDNKVPDIVYEKCKRELVGLGITDMYRVMLEKDIPKESVENDYKKYIPKEVLKRHSFFIKKPIRETLGKLQRTKHDVWFVKEEYLNQLNILAPEYLAETYKAVTDLDGSSCNILLKVSPGNDSSDSGLPEIKFCLESKKDNWQLIGTIEEMAFVTIRIDGTVEINRKNGIPFYLKFNSLPVMWSFISHLDGYYRLACKWTFNICKDATTPSLEKLYVMKCHGPVGGEFSYAKLEEKRLNRPGCFIIRESESKYNQYFIDVCIKNSSKPKTFKLEKINKDEYIFNDDLTRYKSVQQLVAAYNDENASIYFQECLPPSDYDVSPLLLCRKEDISGAALADASALNTLVPNAPLCIDCKDLQIYKCPWCYTIDPSVSKESCLVKDCDKPEECIIIISGKNEGRKIYILPQWKEKGASGGMFFAVKQWDPDKIVGLTIQITPKSGSENIILEIGAAKNEKILLFLNGNLMKEKTLPHLLASGSWTDFWLQLRQEEIMLGYKGVPHPLFEWKRYDIENAFEPTYISFSTLNDHYVGVYFKCDECHTEYTSVNNVFEIFSVGAWLQDGINIYNNFSLKIRGSGTVWLALYNMIHTEDYLYLEINQNRNQITLHKIRYYQPSLLKQTVVNGHLFLKEYWTNYSILFSETYLNVLRNETIIFKFDAQVTDPILIYYFSLGVDNGLIIWSVNCQLLDIDGPPRDGGWSPWSDWTCTVPCGGGDGFRTRTCTNPRPNIRGKLCLGKPIALGKCNDFECGDISPITLNKIRQDLRDNAFSSIVKEGGNVNIPNNKEILNIIGKESPKSHYEWSLNGMLVNEEENRVSLRNGEIFISNAKPVDSGVYVCVLYRINKNRLIFRIVSLSVIPNSYSIITRATKKLNFVCRAVALGFVYSDLVLKIIINETIHKDYGIVMLAAANVYNVRSLAENYSGDWKCVVEQRNLNFSWTTNYIKVLVKKAPNLYIHLMEDELTKPIFGWLGTEKNVLVALIIIVSGSVIVVTLSLVIYFKFLTFKRRAYTKNRRM